ncbi:MAG: GTP-binding protein [Nitrospirae bacterium]|nr:MAG: GTP-binding protein [Nitrospirota bacterium]
MKTTVVCGLLGSGKTTFIKRHFLSNELKTVVLVNDFGSVGIDGEIISNTGTETVELPSGCVCCTLKFDLITTIEKILKELKPERLVIEPSGVASVSGILEALEILKFNDITVVGIIDASEFLEFYGSGMYGSFFEDQIINSGILLINKIDFSNSADVAKIAATVACINPAAIVYKTVNTLMDSALPEAKLKAVRKPESSFHFGFDTTALSLKHGMPFDEIENLFCGLANGTYGNIVRAKALIHTNRGAYRFDLSYGKTDIVPFEGGFTRGRLVLIGEKINRISLTKALGMPALHQTG